MEKTPRCAHCGYGRETKACITPPGKHPDFCPMVNCAETIDGATSSLADPDLQRLAREASLQEAECYANRHARPFVRHPAKPRIQETWEFAQRMDYHRIGLAFCNGLVAEAKSVSQLFEDRGFEVVSVCCKLGAVPKEEIGLRDQDKICAGQHESMCHPVAQAAVLNQAKTELNILLGLCVGHDALFLKQAEAPCTVLAVKDRVTGHNPLAVVYTLGSYSVRFK